MNTLNLLVVRQLITLRQKIKTTVYFLFQNSFCILILSNSTNNTTNLNPNKTIFLTGKNKFIFPWSL